VGLWKVLKKSAILIQELAMEEIIITTINRVLQVEIQPISVKIGKYQTQKDLDLEAKITLVSPNFH
jgi:hypothetical protein